MAEPYSHVGLWTLHDGEAEEGVGWVGLFPNQRYLWAYEGKEDPKFTWELWDFAAPKWRCSTENMGELGTSSPARWLGHSFVRTQG